jgi:SAM-dependent methyltransferase
MDRGLREDQKSYWEGLHREGIRGGDRLGPVCIPDGSAGVNRLYDFAHRLGMRSIFSGLGDLAGKRVLDIGCGRGRWSKEFAARGALVTGIDFSSDAIGLNRRDMPGCTFECMSVLELDRLEPGSFDIVNSVTVIQHVPRDSHEKIFNDIHTLLSKDGTFCMLESIYNPIGGGGSDHADGEYTFFWTRDAWIDLAEGSGFELETLKGCLYLPLMRLYERWIEGGGKGRGVGRRLLREIFTYLSFPAEAVSVFLPDRFATHEAFIFTRKEREG